MPTSAAKQGSNPRVTLVTGASRGVGRGLAERLIANGDIVYGCSRSGTGALSHERYQHFELNVGDEVAVREMLAAIIKAQGRLDLVINNAGLALSRLGLLTSAVDFNRVLEANLLGSFVILKESLRMMKRTRFGRIVNFSSINVPLTSRGGAAYNASKAGLENLSVTLARECGDDDITINCVGLSLVRDSGMVEGLSADALKAKQDQLMKPELISFEEVLHAINFFAAPGARNITAQTVYFGGVR